MRTLRHPLYLIALLVLLANDHLWKATYGNALTGKLSDFAGLFAFAVAAQVLWRNVRGGGPGGIVLAGIFFVWFKSPLSGGALDYLSAWSGLSFGRVVDATDLLALVVLYPAWQLTTGRLTGGWAPLPARSLALLLPLSAVAFVATSVDDDEVFGPSVATCCSPYPVDRAVGDGTLYIPTAFTPDGDGRNDTFRVVADSNIVRIDSLVILAYSPYRPVFQVYNVTDLNPGPGFTGNELDSLPPQAFDYVITATSQDGVTQSFWGQVCALPCRLPTDLALPVRIDSCVFGNQITRRGLDTLRESGERLECFN